MKHIVYLFLILTAIGYAQIGVGTAKPHPSAVIDLSSSKKGLLLPRVLKAEDVVTTVAGKPIPNGLLVYDEDRKCVRFFQDGVWSECFSSTVPVVKGDCASTTFSGAYFQNVPMNAANTFSVTVTNSSFIPATVNFAITDLVLSGVAGDVSVEKVSIASATLGAGASQVVVYTLKGTPTATGTLTATWKNFDLTCTKTVSIGVPIITGVNCSFTSPGSLTELVAASGVSSTMTYNAGNGSTYAMQQINSTGVTGLTATLASGTFLAGGGSLVYTIAGTPIGNGIASFAINIGGLTCTLNRNVSPSVMPVGITLATNQSRLWVSVYDDDYIPYSPPNGAATTNAQPADGNREPIAVNIPQSIDITGLTFDIPATGSGSVPAYSTNVTIPASMTQDGMSRVLNFSWPSGTVSGGKITATIKAIGGTLNIKQLDINAGLGSDGLGLVLAEFPYPYNNSMVTTNFTLRIFPGIPDKMFGKPDNAGNRYTHLMLYYPIVAEDGKTWLSNRLGAHYANIHHTSFNPSKQATGTTVTGPVDHLAYGSLFQWGRRADGHELITWSAGSGVGAGTPVYNTTTTDKSDNPLVTSFITGSSDWRVTRDDLLWQTESSVNNPCPIGFRVPTNTEFTTLFTSAGITGFTLAFNSLLKFSVAGYRKFSDGTFVNVGSTGSYWSSSFSGAAAYSRYISGGTNTFSDDRAFGFSVACLKD